MDQALLESVGAAEAEEDAPVFVQLAGHNSKRTVVSHPSCRSLHTKMEKWAVQITGVVKRLPRTCRWRWRRRKAKRPLS